MTIGIAASGPRAGAAILRALEVAETVGTGAIGGFVSFVAIGDGGVLHRAETQSGGTTKLFGSAGMPDSIANATVAGLMSSGPNRPVPLSQFTPADGRIGLVTGHRMPNTVGASGHNLNEEVLALMAAGATAREAVERVVADNPLVDAGLIALSRSGDLFAADTALVERLSDAGGATLVEGGSGKVAVLHNAIRPYRSLALLVAETALGLMAPPALPDGQLLLAQGVPVVAARHDALIVDDDLRVVALEVRDARFLDGRWSVGFGAAARVVRNGTVIAHATTEPYLVVDSGVIQSIDGQDIYALPIALVR